MTSLIVGLDIGTTKIVAVVGELSPSGVQIVGVGTSPSKGLRKGVVVNIEATVAAMQRAIAEAQRTTKVSIKRVVAGIAGAHIQGVNSHAVVAIKDGEVKKSDIERVIEAAKSVSIPSDREILHTLPQEFIIDGQDGIREPLGMSGRRLEAKIHIVTGQISSAQNIIKCAERCSLEVSDIVLEQLASAYAVLSDDERELGVALIDIGGGTTDVAIFSHGSIQHTSVIPIGGQHLTNDIAVGLRTLQESAEEIKKTYGSASAKMIGKDEVIEVPSIGARPDRILRRQILGDILEPRVEEIFELIGHEIQKVGLRELLASGVVITGGSALLPGLIEVGESILGLPVRRGVPQGVGGLLDVIKSPIYATGVGLVLYGAKNLSRQENVYFRLKNRIGAWIQDMI
ncbi:MAG: cell division protein FtsA [Myxococcaceae bacterium]|nr:cell division protein FtsA [Myxococcaceae bacterium]MBH2006318.1 cell division protein FtsA [Myxococcaceae bacterium]